MNLLKLFSASPRLPISASPPQDRRAAVNLYYEPLNVSAHVTTAEIQNYLRQAELGEVRWLFALYRDISVSGSHIFAELQKRKFAILSEPISILPADKENEDDVSAASACRAMVANCENWTAGLGHLLDATLWPLATAEKIFRPVEDTDTLDKDCPPLTYLLRCLEPINPALYSFHPQVSASPRLPVSASSPAFEPEIHLYPTDPNGRILYDPASAYPLDPARHILHRGHLTGQRDNWGGPMRAILFWWFLAANGRDWFGRTMERYGTPFPVAKTDSTNQSSVTLLRNALALSTRLGGLVVDNDTSIELMEIASNSAADAYEKFLNVCNREISKVIVGQSGSEIQSQGLGSGMAKAQEQVRGDIMAFDRLTLGECLTRQLCSPFLRFNQLKGRVKVIWGGLEPEEATATGKLLLDLANAGLEPSDQALPMLSEKVGFELQRKLVVPALAGPTPFAATRLPQVQHPSDAIAARKSAVLAAAYRGSLAPIREIILSAPDPATAQRQVAQFFSDWSPEKCNQITEEALQLCAAAGASASASKPVPLAAADGRWITVDGTHIVVKDGESAGEAVDRKFGHGKTQYTTNASGEVTHGPKQMLGHSKADSGEFYHGTAAKNAESILEHGIKPTDKTLGFKAAFVGQNKNLAFSYGAGSAATHSDNEVAMVVVKDPGSKGLLSPKGARNIAYHPEGIKPEHIDRIEIYRQNAGKDEAPLRTLYPKHAGKKDVRAKK